MAEKNCRRVRSCCPVAPARGRDAAAKGGQTKKDLNLQPPVLKTVALPFELFALEKNFSALPPSCRFFETARGGKQKPILPFGQQPSKKETSPSNFAPPFRETVANMARQNVGRPFGAANVFLWNDEIVFCCPKGQQKRTIARNYHVAFFTFGNKPFETNSRTIIREILKKL